MRLVKNCSLLVATICAALLCIAAVAHADKLYHVDGTVIEGKIQTETADKILIETKYGRLNYDRADLLRVERSAAAVSVTSGTAAAASINLMKYVPQGPVNPFAPPQMPLLVTLAPRPAGVVSPPVSTPLPPVRK